MLNVSATYESIMSGNHWIEYRLLVEASDRSMKTIDADGIFSLDITEKLLEKEFSIGNASSAQIETEIVDPKDWTPAKMGKLQPQFRICNATQQSEWLPKGTFYIDTRERTKWINDDNKLKLHGYDAMLMAEQDYPSVGWNTASDTYVLSEICSLLGWRLESETAAFFGTTRAGYILPTPFNYTFREVLKSIAAVNCGNFVIDEYGDLRLVRFNALPEETYYLIDQNENKITMGGVHIVLQ